MGVAGMFLGMNSGLYESIKNNDMSAADGSAILNCGVCCMFGWAVGSMFPTVVPVYAASIPCYFAMKYLDKKNLI
jgi:hypothetical protein